MSWEDMNNGRLGIGRNRDSLDWQDGNAQRERRLEAERQRNTPAPPPPPVIGIPHGPTYPGRAAESPSAPEYTEPTTMRSLAKAGAGLFAIGCVLSGLANGTWTWMMLAVYTGMSAVAGAIAGAALYIAVRVAVFALRRSSRFSSSGCSSHTLESPTSRPPWAR